MQSASFLAAIALAVTVSAQTVQPITIARAGDTLDSCTNAPKPFFCTLEGGDSDPSSCPPPKFDAVVGFSDDMLKQFVNAPWFVQYMDTVSYWPSSALFCGRILFEPVDVDDVTAELRMNTYATQGLNGRVVGSSGSDSAPEIALIQSKSNPSKFLVGPQFLRSVPNFQKYYDQFWIVAAGTTPGEEVDKATGFTWAIVTGGQPPVKTRNKFACQGEGDRDGNTLREILWFVQQVARANSPTNPFVVTSKLLLELGFENLETVLEKIFSPSQPARFDLVGVLKLLDLIDLRPLLPLLDDEEIQAGLAPVLTRVGNADVDDAIKTIQGLGGSQPVTFSKVLAALSGLTESRFISLLPLASLFAPNLLKEAENGLKEFVLQYLDTVATQRREGLWLLTRDEVPSQVLVDDMFQVVRRLGLNDDVLEEVTQQGCTYVGAPAKRFQVPI